jgi:hypothetical protein
MASQLYYVEARHQDRNQFVGIVNAHSEKDVEAFYSEEAKKSYGLIIKVLTPVGIPLGYADQKDKLLAQKAILKAQLENLDDMIENPSQFHIN